ncbi:MAG: T9SS type A sorting domain-containing protein [Chitinophagaceae bacterium]
MKKPKWARVVLYSAFAASFSFQKIEAQIGGSSSVLQVNPLTPSIIDSNLLIGQDNNLINVTVQITNNYHQGDILSFDGAVAARFGVSGSYHSTDASGVLTFTGTTSSANWQTILRSVTFENHSADHGASTRNILFLQGNVFYNETNGHYYEFVNESKNWKDAKTDAEQRSFNGMGGYLSTITSDDENNFLWKLVATDAWVGASNDYEEINAAKGDTTFENQENGDGHQYWVTGPEKGTSIPGDAPGSTEQSGQYSNWAEGEPNNSNDEHYVHLYSGNKGKWNDLNNYAILPYIVEYGGLSSDAPENNTFTRSLDLGHSSNTDNNEDQVVSNVVVYPNPFRNLITIDADSNEIGDIVITDIAGKTVYRAKISSTKETINLSRLAAGQYNVLRNGHPVKIIKL